MFMLLSIKIFLSLAYFVLIFLFWDVGAAVAGNGSSGIAAPTNTSVNIGLILDSTSPMSAMVDLSISMAILDFYAVHPDYQTRLVLHRRDVQDEINVASAALELLKNEEVHTILGAQMFAQERFVAELGGKARVPIISFSARNQYIQYKQSPYFIRATSDDSNQARALASICKEFEWHEAVVLYEDSEYGSQFLGKLTDAFIEVQIQVAYTVPISTSAEDRDIMIKLKRLTVAQTRLFLVHMNPNLGSRLFLLAKQVGIMSEGYAWIITDSIGNFMNAIDYAVIDSMEGVIGLRPYVPKSKNLKSFRTRWIKNIALMNTSTPEISAAELNVYGLWAYDAVWALAMAVEKIRPVSSSFLKVNRGFSKGSGIFDLRISQFGPELLAELQNITFEGLGGKFHMINGQLKTSTVEIFNIYETERPIGYWTPDGGIMRKLSIKGTQKYSTATSTLKGIIWPGDSTNKPKGWAIPTTGKLKVGVPKKDGFLQFVNVSQDPVTKKTTNVTGYSIDIFLSVLQQLPFIVDHEFIAFNESYNDLLNEIRKENCDMVVGDTTILANRAKYVDFTLPYSEAGAIMVVGNRNERDIWSFVKPFRWDLWLLMFGTCMCISIVLRILERRENCNSGSIEQKKQKPSLFFPISALAFLERNLVTNKWSRFVMVVWLLMAFILMQSYTAILSAVFTVNQLAYRFSSNDYIGVQTDSFVRDFLIHRQGFDESRIREYATIEEFHDAMVRGSAKGGIDAIFDEVPYMNLFLEKYGSEYKIVGPIYKTDGFAFAFPVGSPLVSYFSRAILEVTEGVNLTAIQLKNFGPTYSPSNSQISSINTESPKLTVQDFGGLFIIIGSTLVFALLCSETPIGQRITNIVTNYSKKSFSFLSFRGNDSRIHSTKHSDDANIGYSCSDDEAQGIDHMNQVSGQGQDLNISAKNGQVNESEQGNPTNKEIQLSELGNTNVTEIPALP